MATRLSRNAARKPAMAERRARQNARTVGFTEANRLIIDPLTGAVIGKSKGQSYLVRASA